VCFQYSNWLRLIIEGCLAKRSKEDVVLAKQKFPARIAHRRAPIAATTGLVEHKVAMLPVQLRHQFDGGIGGENLIGNPGHWA